MTNGLPYQAPSGRLSRRIWRDRNLNRLAFLSFVTIILLSVILINPAVESNVKAATNLIETELTLTNLDDTVSVDVEARGSMGSFATSQGEETARFTLATNNYTGYTLSFVADDDDGYLSATTSSDALISIDRTTTTSDFSANTQEAATAYNGKWGIKPSKYMDGNNVISNNTEDPVFLPSPTTTPTRLDKTTEANIAGTENEYTIGLGVRANHDVTSGIYTRTFQLIALANPATYSVTFDSHTNDTISGMPENQSSAAASDLDIDLPNTVPERDHYSFIGWCSIEPTTYNGVDYCSATVYNPDGNGTDLTYHLNQTTANDATLYAMWKIDTFTCTKQYRLENGDGTWGEYIVDEVETINYGASCYYSKSMTDYHAQFGPNNSIVSAQATNISQDKTISLDLYRNTFYLSVEADYHTSNPTESDKFRWGEIVEVSVTKAPDNTCTHYDDPVWTASAGTAPAPGETTTFEMPKTHVTLTAGSTPVSIQQTISLSMNGGASKIVIDNVKYTEGDVSLRCGTHLVSGEYDEGYEFDSWTGGDGVKIIHTDESMTHILISEPGSLSLAGKASTTYIQNITADTCPTVATTVYDRRDDQPYTIQKLADGNCWMLDNLAIGASSLKEPISSANTNIPEDTTFSLPGSSVGNFANNNNMLSAQINTASADKALSYGTGTSKVGVYYNYCAASAGAICGADNRRNSDPDFDLCPKGWRIPSSGSSGEFITLYNAYNKNLTEFKEAFHAALTGIFFSGQARGQDGYAHYWSATYSGASRNMHDFAIEGSSVYTITNNARYYGEPVRCILK